MRPLSWRHLDQLTDEFGIWQHTEGQDIARQHGYALDDAARALILTARANDLPRSRLYLRFLEHACQGDTITNFFDADQQSRSLPWSEDALGETYWALAETEQAGIELPRAAALRHHIEPRIKRFRSLRGRAYALLGSTLVQPTLANRLADQLMADCPNNKPDWPWPEPSLTYANALLPLSLLTSAKQLNRPADGQLAQLLLDFLNQTCKENGLPIAIGNQGWYPEGQKKALFDQQPIDIAYHVLANIKAYEVTGQTDYLTEAKLFFSWFSGQNIGNLSLINSLDDSVHDGLSEQGISQNRGAENIICYLLTEQALLPHLNPRTAISRQAVRRIKKK